jgi:hypothetical protein
MTENRLVIRAVRKDSSLSRYVIRYHKDICLHDDVELFLSNSDTGLTRLVNKLVNNEFRHARYTDPEYPG